MDGYIFSEKDLEEYNETLIDGILNNELKIDWTDSDKICEKCSSKMKRSMQKITFLIPAQFIYKCEKCNGGKLEKIYNIKAIH